MADSEAMCTVVVSLDPDNPVPLLLLAQVPVMQSRYDGDAQAAVEATIPYGQWLGWIVNLLIAQYVIHRWRTHPETAPT